MAAIWSRRVLILFFGGGARGLPSGMNSSSEGKASMVTEERYTVHRAVVSRAPRQRPEKALLVTL